MSCFVGYTDTNTIHKIWNFERKKFERSHDLIFKETQFSKSNDFNESSANFYNSQTLSSSSSSSFEFKLTSESDDRSSRQVYNEIIVMNESHLRYLQLLSIYPCLCNVDFKAFITNCLISNS